ncbi:MAG TPA: vanadium-dependent haloperoxidase [Puia sp.]|nr:vanadium-dependent haloperoxidase [Puia sp.]
MKQYVKRPRESSLKKILIVLLIAVSGITGCRKEPGFRQDFPASLYSSDVIDKWMTLEIRIYKDATGIGNGAFGRPFAYSGITAYESIDPGLLSWKNKYNGLSDLPETDKFKKYNWPASVNASLAEFNRSFFTTSNLNATDLAAIDSLENAISSTFGGENVQTLSRSVAFGKSMADAIFAWSQTDGYNQNNALPYTPPVGPGLWTPTPPANAPASGPYWGNDHRIIAGSGDHSQPGLPTAYSEDPTSDFYKMVNDLYQASKVLTTEQKNQALFWRDVPGVSTPGHWMSITRQAILQSHSRLDKAALGYALVGICVNEAVISVFKAKYTYNLVRPITYIRKVIGDTAWLSFIATPAHPEYPAAHGVVSASAAEGLTAVFGNIGPLTDYTWDYLGFPARTFNTFREFALDAGNSRFYGGIHYQPSINLGLRLGKIVGDNVVNSLSPNTDWKK